MDFSNKYVMGFAFAICMVCAGIVSTLAVALKPKQDFNQELYERRQVIRVSGIADKSAPLPPEEVDEIFKSIKGMVPKTRLGRQQLSKLKVYAGSEHPHGAQSPEPLVIEHARLKA